MAYTRRSYVPKKPVVNNPKNDDLNAEDYSVDWQLDDLTRKVIRRCHQEIDRYSVPQLLSALHKCLQVRVLIATLRAKGGGENVGSAVKRYSGAFADQAQKDDTSRGKRSTRSRPAFSDPDDTIIQLITSDD